MRGRWNDLTGEQIGLLTVIECDGFRTGGYHWKCRCACGKEIVRSGKILLTINSASRKSCGCDTRRTHPKYRKTEWNIWQGMRERCNNPNSRGYKYYGARGIRVCDEWMNSFDAFYADMGDRPSPKHSIDRIDNDGDYEPRNCRWATNRQQASNKRPRYSVSEALLDIDADEYY